MSAPFRLFLVLCLLLVAPAVQAADPFPSAARAYLVQAGGTLVWEHQADRRLPPASLTKIMTALLVLERGNLEQIVTVSPAAAAETGSRLRLRAGERLRVGDLLAAMLIESANDAAHVLADYLGGSEARFVTMMNARAARLGLKNTHFVNCAGHDHPQHYSSANDLARLTEAALSHPLFRQLVSQVKYEVRTVGGKRIFRMENSNKLLPRYPGMVGVKTGYTRGAGRCLIALAERDGVEILIVLLRAPDRWNIATRMLDHAFQYYADTRKPESQPLVAGR
jgi:D-alanyl-D-alanine carboxypeptidase (penicillin-binding protein 5/6)